MDKLYMIYAYLDVVAKCNIGAKTKQGRYIRDAIRKLNDKTSPFYDTIENLLWDWYNKYTMYLESNVDSFYRKLKEMESCDEHREN